ncbi:MAG TPA: YeeE/YedE thiosulfate transporter family protein [Anaerolineae bacterium]
MLKLPYIKMSAMQAGLIMGGGAAFIQAYLKIIPPPAYGICFVCHPKDLFNWVSDHIFGTNFGNVTVSVDWPVLTVVGVVLGAFIAAKQHGEFHLEDAREPFFHFMTGFAVINFGLILGSCPIRIIIVSAYGSLIGIVGYACMILGIVLGSLWLRNRARNQVRRRMEKS